MDIRAESSWRSTLWRWAPLVLWIGVIFYMSSDQGSMSQTSRFIRPLLEWLFPTASEATLQLYHGYIRKLAHFTEYAILAFLALRAFMLSSSEGLRRYRYLLPIAVAATIASIDEFNQSFSAARSGSIWDVLLDISGAIAMMIFARLTPIGKAGEEFGARHRKDQIEAEAARDG